MRGLALFLCVSALLALSCSAVDVSAGSSVRRALSGRRFAAALDRTLADQHVAVSARPQAAAAAAKPVCLFIHGSGQKGPYAVTDSYAGYWGKTEQYVSHLCTAKFVHYASVDRGWDDKDLLAEVCKAIKETGPRVIVAHSMGNLIMSVFMKKPDLCPDFKQASMPLISLQGPWKGSVASTACKKVCKSPNPLWLPVQHLKQLCDCEGSGAQAHPPASVMSVAPEYNSSIGMTWTDHADNAKKAAYSMCGNNPLGIFSLDSLGLELAQDILPASGFNYGPDRRDSDVKPVSGTDGMVPFRSSCAGAFDPDTFEFNPKATRYVGHINHAAGSLRDGESRDDLKKQPVTFVVNALQNLLK